MKYLDGLKGVGRFSTSSLFHGSVSSWPLSIPSGHFPNIWGDISNLVFVIGANDTKKHRRWNVHQCKRDTGNILLPVSLLTMINYCRCCWHRWLCLIHGFLSISWHRLYFIAGDIKDNLSPVVIKEADINLVQVPLLLAIKLLEKYQSAYTLEWSFWTKNILYTLCILQPNSFLTKYGKTLPQNFSLLLLVWCRWHGIIIYILIYWQFFNNLKWLQYGIQGLGETDLWEKLKAENLVKGSLS